MAVPYDLKRARWGDGYFLIPRSARYSAALAEARREREKAFDRIGAHAELLAFRLSEQLAGVLPEDCEIRWGSEPVLRR